MNDIARIAYAIHPELPRINDFSYEVDGEDINVSLCIGNEWKDEVISRKDFEKWLNDNDYLNGNYDANHSAANDYQGETIWYHYTYSEFLADQLDDEIVRDYLSETNQYLFHD